MAAAVIRKVDPLAALSSFRLRHKTESPPINSAPFPASFHEALMSVVFIIVYKYTQFILIISPSPEGRGFGRG
jgi:hypothetical protein